MNHSTTDIYQMKRDILSFSKIISQSSHRPDIKFAADMIYGILASGSCHLTDIVDQLHEKTQKVNSVERLTKHLNKGVPSDQLLSYLKYIRTLAPKIPVIHIDDSRMAISSKASVMFGMAPKVLILKLSIPKAIM